MEPHRYRAQVSGPDAAESDCKAVGEHLSLDALGLVFLFFTSAEWQSLKNHSNTFFVL
jgi:hypothetical protein